MSYETRYAAKKHQQQRDRDASPEAIQERIIRQRAVTLARAEALARFPQISADTFQPASDYQDERIAFHVVALTKAGAA